MLTMADHFRSSVLVIIAWLFVLPLAGLAEEPPATEEAKKASLQAKDLAAFQAFRSLVSAQSFGLSDDELAKLMDEHLKAAKAAPGRSLPTAMELRSEVQKRFEVTYEAMLGKATKGLDPDGTLGLEKRLRKYLDEHDSVRKQVSGRYQEYLDKEFPGAVARVGKRMAIQQAQELQKALAGYMKDGKLSAARLETAFQNHKEPELAGELERDILQSYDPTGKRPVLADALGELRQDAQKAVANGVEQLKQRLDALTAKPQARTLAGMVKELKARVFTVRDAQAKKGQTESLWGLYEEFPMESARVQEAARRHFDRAVAAITKRLGDDLRAGVRKLPEQDRGELEGEIRSNAAAHSEKAASKKALQPKITTLIAASSKWIIESARGFCRSSPLIVRWRLLSGRFRGD